MTHWHIITAADPKYLVDTSPHSKIIGVARYDEVGPSIIDFSEMCSDIFTNEDVDIDVVEKMLAVAETETEYIISCTTKNLTFAWKDCDAEPCSFASYN